MKTSHLGLLGLVLAAAPLGACNETAVGTDTVRTQGFWAAFEVKATGAANSKLEAKLRVGGSGGTPAYPLTGSDKLLVSIDGSPETEMGETCQASNTFCTGNLGDVAGKVVRVNFDRGSDFENAPNSTVKVPAAFQVSAKKDEVVRGEQDVELTISGGASGLRYRVTGDCIWTEDGLISDGKIPKSAITSPRSDAKEDCEVTVVVTRATEGELDPNFGKGGRIVAIQERKFKFLSVTKPTPPDDTTEPVGDTSTAEPSSSSPDTLGDAGTDGGTDGGSENTSAVSTDTTSTGATGEATSTGAEETSTAGGEETSTGAEETSTAGGEETSTAPAEDTSSTGAEGTSSTGAEDTSSTGAEDTSSTDADAGSSDAPDAGDAG